MSSVRLVSKSWFIEHLFDILSFRERSHPEPIRIFRSWVHLDGGGILTSMRQAGFLVSVDVVARKVTVPARFSYETKALFPSASC